MRRKSTTATAMKKAIITKSNSTTATAMKMDTITRKKSTTAMKTITIMTMERGTIITSTAI